MHPSRASHRQHRARGGDRVPNAPSTRALTPKSIATAYRQFALATGLVLVLLGMFLYTLYALDLVTFHSRAQCIPLGLLFGLAVVCSQRTLCFF